MRRDQAMYVLRRVDSIWPSKRSASDERSWLAVLMLPAIDAGQAHSVVVAMSREFEDRPTPIQFREAYGAHSASPVSAPADDQPVEVAEQIDFGAVASEGMARIREQFPQMFTPKKRAAS